MTNIRIARLVSPIHSGFMQSVGMSAKVQATVHEEAERRGRKTTRDDLNEDDFAPKIWGVGKIRIALRFAFLSSTALMLTCIFPGGV